MADITTFKKYAIYRIGTGVGVPTVATGVNSTATTITSTVPFVDQDGVAIAEEMLVSAKLTIGDHKGEIEVFRVPAGGVSADGTTFTGCVRGIEPGGLDEAGNADFALDLPEGTILGIAVASLQFTAICDVLKGTLPTGANALKIGDGTAADITITAHNNDASKPFVRYDDSDSKWIYSNNGVDTLDVGGGTGTITSGDGIEINTGVVAVDLDTNPGLEFNSGDLRAKVKASGGITRDADGLSIDQANVKIAENVAVTATSTEINRIADGVSVNSTATNVNTLTAGATSNADALHTHSAVMKKIGTSVTDQTITSGTVTDLFSFTVPANTLGTNNAVKIELFVTAFNKVNANNETFNLIYGTTTIAALTIAMDDAGTGLMGKIEGIVYASGATNTQEGMIYCNLHNNTGSHPVAGVQVGTGAEDSTASKTFKVQVDHPGSGSPSITVVNAICYQIT